MRWFSDLAGTFIDAWSELRVHRTRVFLALLGVLIAVCAITTVTGMGALVRQSAMEINDRFGGRPASYSISASGGASPRETQTKFTAALKAAVERYGITYASRESHGTMTAQFPDGTGEVQVVGVDQAFGDMRRVPIVDGAWFAPDDHERLAPAVVVNETMWQELGAPDLRSAPVLRLTAPSPTDAVIVGVYRADSFGTPQSQMYVLADVAERLGAASSGTAAAGPTGGAPGQQLLWLPPETGDELTARIKADLTAALGEGVTVTVQRTDYLASGQDPFLAVQILISIVSSIVLAVGAVGYVNLAIVTVRARIREIGIRRTFGATGSRVFASVLLESVVGTTLAGVIGIAIAVLILQNPSIQLGITGGMGATDVVPFPIEAAVTGLAVSVGVGLVAGLIPAVIATRVRVIDAIRSS